jgi:hypothetical protein
LRLTSQKTTALNIVLAMTLILSACTAEDDTGREHTGGDRNDDIGVDSKPRTSEASIGHALTNRRFMSIEKQELGLGLDGAEMGHWVIYFSSSTFEWAYSDVAESGTYVLNGKRVMGQSGDREILGEYDPDSDILTWDGTDYRSVETP